MPALPRALLLAALCAAPALGRAAVGLRRGGAGASAGQLRAHAARAGSSSWAPSPVQRVIQLLQEMKAQLTQEASKDAKAYDKMVCWCKTNTNAKTQAIADAESKIDELDAEVGVRSGRDGELASKIGILKSTLAEKKKSFKTATALREEEHAAFNKEETEMVQAVTMLKNAILVLSKHNAGLLQITPAMQESLGTALRWVALKHEELLEESSESQGGLRRSNGVRISGTALLSLGSGGAAASTDSTLWQRQVGDSTSPLPLEFAARILAQAAAQAGSSFAQQSAGQPAKFDSYSAQSGQIFGILQRMKEEFEANLSESQKTELKAQSDFAELKGALEKEISASTAKLDELEEAYGANTKALSDAKEDLTMTREVRASDVKFLSDLRLECQDLDHQWKQRSTARGEEIKAVSEAIAILTEDDARDLFHKKMGTGSAASFLQVAVQSQAQQTQQALRSRAASLLLRAAGKLASRQDHAGWGPYQVWHASEDKPHEQLAAMAVQVQLDAFTKVKKAIDDMVAELKSQQEQEVKHKAFCTSSLNDNEKDTHATSEELSDLKDAIGELGATIEKLTDDVAAAKKAIAGMEVEIKKAGEVREQENKIFQEEVMDQRAVQQILSKAIARMRLVYKDTSLAQESPTSPVKFKAYKQNAGASGAISLMQQIVEDSKKTENEALSAENAAQTAYEEFVKDSNASIKSLNEAIATKSRLKAEAGVEKEEREAQHRSTEERLEGLAAFAADLHAQCDFVLKNFNIRQKARLDEIEALGSVKALLSGMAMDDE